MKFLIIFSLFLVAVSAQYGRSVLRPFQYPFAFPLSEEYAASLGGAKVGLYGKSGLGGSGLPYGFPYGFPFSPYGFPKGFPLSPYGFPKGLDITGASLGGAKVGLYGKDRQG